MDIYYQNEQSMWKPIRSTKCLPEGQKTLTNTEPTILIWQWFVPPEIDNKAGILVIIDSPQKILYQKIRKYLT